MTEAEENFDDQFANLLARYEAELTAGESADTSRLASLDDRLAGRLVKAGECLELLEQVWPRRRATALDGEPLPEAVDRFEIIRELGRGGFGIVYLAFDPVLRRQVALKLQRPETVLSPELRRRFLGEAHAAGALNHPNIVAVYEVGEASVLAWIAVEYCPGMSLAQWLARWQTPVPPRLAAEFVAQLADAVAYAHSRGILHRDIKPSNVLLVEADSRARQVRADGPLKSSDDAIAAGLGGASALGLTHPMCFDGGGAPCPPEPSVLAREATWFLSVMRPKLTDFGLAKVLDGDAVETKSGTQIGTPGYMAPEQIESTAGTVGPATDVYGLGLVLYEMLTAKAAFAGTTRAETFKRVLLEEPPSPRKLCRQVPRDLSAIALEAIDKKPDRRYFSAAELAIDLRRYLADKPVRARQPRWYEHAWRFVRRRPAWVTTATLLIIAGCLIAAVARYSAENHALLGLRPVRFSTDPPNSRVVFVPLDEFTGEPNPVNAVRPRGRTPIRAELKPGDYFVVVALDDVKLASESPQPPPKHPRRFHEVYRHVPASNREVPSEGFPYRNWTMRDGDIVIPPVQIPPATVIDQMAFIGPDRDSEGQAQSPSSFYMDCHEFTVGDAIKLRGRPVRFDIQGASSEADHALACSYSAAVQLAEEAGKRLPSVDEYRAAVQRRIPHAQAPTEPADRATDFGPVGFPAEDRTNTVPPIFGLYSNVAEWTATYPPRLTQLRPTEDFDARVVFGGDRPVIDGSATLAPAHREAAPTEVLPIRTEKPGLGFRCVRSLEPHYLAD